MSDQLARCPGERESSESIAAGQTRLGFLVGFAHGEIWMLDEKTGIRIQLGTVAGTSLQDADVKVLTCLGQFVFVGAKRGTRNVLQVFNVGPVLGNASALRASSPDSLSLAFDSHTKHRGLGAVRAVANASRDPERGQAVLVACGRGIGKAHLWRFWLKPESQSSIQIDYVGGIGTKTNTIDAIALSACGNILVVTSAMENLAQAWHLPAQEVPFELRSSSAQRINTDLDSLQNALLGDSAAASQLGREHASHGRDNNLLDLIQSRGEPWPRLFPPRLLDPAAYDGDTDAQGRPHGVGSQLLDERGYLLYTGEWKNGERHGVGQVIDERSGKIVYVGGWRHGLRHGFGLELRTGSTDTGEVYEGWWRNGARHGLGSVYLSKQASGLSADSASKERIRYVGFFREGKQHGLGWWTWPAQSPLLPFAVTLNAMAHLGAIRCIVQFKDGHFFDEFGFHRVDGIPISVHEQSLFNFPARRRAKFAEHADGRWAGAECWGCMSSTDSDDWVTCGNPSCGMRMHLECLGRTARQFPSCELARALYCEDLSAREMKKLRLHIGDHLVFYCPMPVCQEMALSLPKVADKGGVTEDSAKVESTTKAPSTNTVVKGSTEETVQRKSKTRRNARPRKNNKNKNKDKRLELELDENLFLREALADPPFVGAKLPIQGKSDDEELFAYYNADRDLVVLATDEDLEEALEEATLVGSKSLHIFKLPPAADATASSSSSSVAA
ncbi:MORN repeat-containing protein 4 [Hondaea fermentalgiana]|uniref:MORN repeat-containing protein 4 n=1 Tax=Hondaea fermentalgiana TaxID=2315210 RepID=A0A2R5GGF7_9STRA|nr:MORN repeat-containing protein 4 [Hondaea fermentalgiana]|eukprot:GBG29967.1 MORN repeat-containing protein 4 [Hondaea fermentalgiana]